MLENGDFWRKDQDRERLEAWGRMPVLPVFFAGLESCPTD
jgi:hypothetical protein